MLKLFLAVNSNTKKSASFGMFDNISYWNANGRPELWMVHNTFNLAKHGNACYPAIDVAYGRIGVAEAVGDTFVILASTSETTLEFSDKWLLQSVIEGVKVFELKHKL